MGVLSIDDVINTLAMNLSCVAKTFINERQNEIVTRTWRCVSGRMIIMVSMRFQWLVCALLLMPVAKASAEEISHYSGEQLFARFCAACHGDKAEGNGPVAPFFKLAPPDLTRLAARRGGKFPTEDVRNIIDGRKNTGAHGARNMPIWGMEFQYADTGSPEKQKQVEALIDRLVQYLRSIQRSETP